MIMLRTGRLRAGCATTASGATWRKHLGNALAFVLLATGLFAQSPTASQSAGHVSVPAEISSVTRPVNGSAAKLHDNSFVIGNGDVLAINVWKQPDISRSLPVRSDGRISLPLVGEVQAAGLTPLKLEEDITGKLQAYLTEPEVTVIVEKINSEKFNILGRVAKPGSYPLTDPTTVLDAIALAGGCRDFAKNKAIYILRVNPDGSESRIPFNYQNVIKGKNLEQNILLRPHDTIVIP
jgi:polysaccharide biosynthesis/export protein